DERTLATLHTEQVEFADVVVVNKTDLVSEDALHRVEATVRAINPDAHLIRSERGRVPLASVLGTGRFDMEAAQRRPAWVQELLGTHTPETEAYGISSFVYRTRHPFHPERFHALLRKPWPGVIRAKGRFWLASRPDHTGAFQLAGGTRETGAAGFWWAAIPPHRRPDDPAFHKRLQSMWHPVYGDRKQEIVIIGVDLNEAAIRSAFDACLLTEAERAHPEQWAQLVHPFPWPAEKSFPGGLPFGHSVAEDMVVAYPHVQHRLYAIWQGAAHLFRSIVDGPQRLLQHIRRVWISDTRRRQHE
ncbi:MAG: GTP-binding protein, partial [Myxococcota bacterium]